MGGGSADCGPAHGWTCLGLGLWGWKTVGKLILALGRALSRRGEATSAPGGWTGAQEVQMEAGPLEGEGCPSR